MNKQLMIDLIKINNYTRRHSPFYQRYVDAAEKVFKVLPDRDEIYKEDIDEAQDYLNRSDSLLRLCPMFKEYTNYICDSLRMYIHHTETDYLGDYAKMRKRSMEFFKEALED